MATKRKKESADMVPALLRKMKSGAYKVYVSAKHAVKLNPSEILAGSTTGKSIQRKAARLRKQGKASEARSLSRKVNKRRKK